MPASDKARDLALQIARCPTVADTRSDGNHPCHQITALQRYAPGSQLWQVPEPWRGDIENAPLLFVSSNPSIDPLDDCPWNTHSDVTITNYYTGDKIAPEFPYASYGVGKRMRRPVPFWTAIHSHACALFDRPEVRPGTDYALTEIVHCKSREEYGVLRAVTTCTKRFLSQVLSLSRADVIVCLGDIAERAFREHVAVAGNPGVKTSAQILTLPHPNARKPRTVAHCLSADQLDQARGALRKRE